MPTVNSAASRGAARVFCLLVQDIQYIFITIDGRKYNNQGIPTISHNFRRICEYLASHSDRAWLGIRIPGALASYSPLRWTLAST